VGVVENDPRLRKIKPPEPETWLSFNPTRQVAMGLARINRAAEIDSRFRFAAKVLHHGLTNEDFERVKKAAMGE
jgi:hypothetical protein